MISTKKQYDFLITGAAGYIGRNLCEYLLKKKYKIIAIDNFQSSTFKTIKPLIKKFKNIKFIKKDFVNIESNFSVKNIIHLAANSCVEKSIIEKESYYQNNVDKLKIFLEKVKYLNCTNFIFFSSAAVYQEKENTKIKEKDKTNPKSIYGKTKLKGEKIISQFSKKNKIKFTVLRLFNVIGGNLKNTKSRSVLKIWIESFKKSKPIIIHKFCTRDFVDICFISEVVQKISETKKKFKKKIFNLGSGKNTSIDTLFKMFYSELKIKKKLKILYKKKPKNFIKNSSSNNQKILKFLNLKYNIDIKKSIKTALSHF